MRLAGNYQGNQEALELIRLIKYTNASVFLTGKAGTGKSTLLKNLVAEIRKNYIILAPTGIAALNVSGQTIHSFFQFEPRPYLPNDRDLTRLTKKDDLLKNLDLIIIDEISMVRADLMNAIDLSLRMNLKSGKPFGGKQLLLIGDLFQLPPVIDSKKVEEVEILRNNYETPYFFSSKQIANGFDYFLIELKKVYRQTDPTFIEILNGVRENKVSNANLAILNRRHINHIGINGNSFEIILATTNLIVKNTNETHIQALKGKLYTFRAITTGDFNNETKESKLPADRVLNLKVGAQVMFIKNDRDKRWVNGTLGSVVSIGESALRIKTNLLGETLSVEKVKWENYEYQWDKEANKIEKKVTGTFTQFPLKLAWAVTIHKSQGQTFDNVTIDMGRGAFATGQTYVALSRCRTLNGIKLKTQITQKDIQTDGQIFNYLKTKASRDMDQSKYDRIVAGMQEKLNQLEPLNEELSDRVLSLKRAVADLEKRSNEIVSESDRVNVENRELKQKLSSSRNTVTWLVVGLIILILILFNK